MKHTDTAETQAGTNVQALNEPEWVRAEKYFEKSGVPVETQRYYKKTGVWQDGKHIATISNRLHVNIREIDKWMSKQAQNCRRA